MYVGKLREFTFQSRLKGTMQSEYLESSLEDGHWKGWIWFGTQPHSKVWIHLCVRMRYSENCQNKIFLYTTVISLTKSWFKRNSLLFLMCIFSWLATFSSTIPQLVILHMTLVYYFHIKWCYNIGITQIANHWWRRCGSLHGIKGYHSNRTTYLTLSCTRPTYRFYSV